MPGRHHRPADDRDVCRRGTSAGRDRRPIAGDSSADPRIPARERPARFAGKTQVLVVGESTAPPGATSAQAAV